MASRVKTELLEYEEMPDCLGKLEKASRRERSWNWKTLNFKNGYMVAREFGEGIRLRSIVSCEIIFLF